MATTCLNKKERLYESFTSINQSTTLENIYENSNINIPNIKYTNIGDYNNIIISKPETKDPSSSQRVIIESDPSDNSIISYIEDPMYVKVQDQVENIKLQKHIDYEKNEVEKWDGITTFYVSALSVIGLFVVYRALQKSK